MCLLHETLLLQNSAAEILPSALTNHIKHLNREYYLQIYNQIQTLFSIR